MERPYLSTSELTSRARSGRGVLPDLPLEATLGYPVPLLRDDRVALAFLLFILRGRPPEPPQVSPPGWVLHVDAETGAVSGQRLEADLTVSLGVHTLTPKPSYQELLDKQARLSALLDALLPLVRNPQWASAETYRQRVSEYRALWLLLAHKPLAAHYRQLNPSWFDTLGIR